MFPRAAAGFLAVLLFLLSAGGLGARGGVEETRFFNRVYLTDTQAVALQKANPEDRAVPITLTLSDAEIQAVRKEQKVKMFSKEYRVWKIFAKNSEKPPASPYRYAIFLQEPGQHEYMDLMFGVNSDGTIHRVDLMVYREPYGGEVAGRRFMKQFEGRSLATSKFRVNQDVTHIVGATISANAVADATRRALGLLRLKKLIP